MSKYIDKFHEYAEGIHDGTIIACRPVKLAIARHLRDMEASKKRRMTFPYELCDEPIIEFCEWIEQMPHTKGKWARSVKGEPNTIKLEPWQIFWTGSTFGWQHRKLMTRRFNESRLYVPRKNAKSTLAAAIGNKLAFADNEPGAEVYSGATTEDQAWEIFGVARNMVLKLPDMREELGIIVQATAITAPADGSIFETVTGKPGDGASPSGGFVDEYHEHKTSITYDTLKTGMGARDNPVLIITSTAGVNIAGPCHDDWTMCLNLLEGVIENDRLFAMIYCADKEDDWKSELAMIKANPNYDVSVSGEFLRGQLRDALNSTRKQATYKTKHLNIWCSSANAYFDLEHWDQSSRPELKMEEFKERKLIVTLDLASKIDLAAAELLFLPDSVDGEYVRFGLYWIPEKALEDPNNEHYRQWVEEGWIVATPGNVIDFNFIQAKMEELAASYNLLEVGYDPFQATMLITNLMSKGIECVEFPQTVKNMSEPMKEADSRIKEGRTIHNGDPVMKWCLSNVEAKEDMKDNVYPRKANLDRSRKIDAAVAHIMAVGRSIAHFVGSMSDSDFDDFINQPLMGG